MRFGWLLLPLLLMACALLLACERAALPLSQGFGPNPALPAPQKTLIPTVDIAPATSWPKGTMPTAARGLHVTEFAAGLDHPRWLHVLPNGDVLVAETNAPPKPARTPKALAMKLVMKVAGAGVPSADRITLLRDTDGDGVADLATPFLTGLHSPFGMALMGSTLYVANTDAVMAFPYIPGATRITAAGRKVIDLPAGPINHHWTKDLIAGPDGTLYATVGSNSNAAENGLAAEQGRAAVWRINPATGQATIFASGLRNPNGLQWEPVTRKLWVAVNERDEIGSDLVPDYMTSLQQGGFYGWPYSWWGDHIDTRVPPNPAMVARAIRPDYALGPHTASLGLAFAKGFAGWEGIFIGQHGSWNRKPPSGYKVIFIPFAQGKPAGEPRNVLTGFLAPDGTARGRPVGVAMDGRGGLLVADDVGNRIWRVTP